MRYPTYLTTLTLCLLAAAAVRLPGIGAPSVWFDEGWSAHAAAQPSLWAAANADTTNPPLYYVLIYLSAHLTGHTEFGLRWLSFALGMLAVALAARLGRAHTRGAAVGAGLVAALNLPLVWASQEMRMYTLLAVLVALAALGWAGVRERRTRGAWALLLGAELALLYTHNSGPVIVLWLNAATLAAWAVTRRGPGFWHWAGGQVLVAALWGPYFVARFLLLTEANSALVRRTAPDVSVWAGLWLAPWEAVSAVPAATLWLTGVPVAAALVALRARAGRWAALHLLLLVGGLLVALAVLGNALHGRYLVMGVPVAAALVGAGLASAPRPVAGALAAGMVALFAVGWPLLRDPAYGHDNARAMVQHYAATLTAADTVVAWSYADRYELAYYWERLGVAARRVTLPEGAELAAVLPLLPRDGDISLNVWYTQRADYRGMLDCVLAHGTPGEPDVVTVAGMATRTYRTPPLAPPDLRPGGTSLPVGAVTTVGVLPDGFHAAQAACVPVALRLGQPTPAELHAAVVVRDGAGREVVNVSSVFATADGRTSVDNALGEVLTAYPVLRLPPGTPPGAYTVSLRVFDAGQPSGYDVLVGGGPAGKDAPLGTWTVGPGARWPQAAPVAALTLDAVALSPHAATNGAAVDVALTWRAPAGAGTPLPAATLRARDGGWAVRVPPVVGRYDNLVTEWRRVRLPLDAPAGEAVLVVDGWGEVGALTLTRIPAVTTRPPVANRAEGVFPGVGVLAGYETDGPLTDGFTVTLVWRAANERPIPHNYTVFVQLLDGNGALVAQSDAQPAGGARPTTTWRPGEYIVDTHTLTFHRADAAGPLTLIAGLYDAGGRLTTADGTQRVELATHVE